MITSQQNKFYNNQKYIKFEIFQRKIYKFKFLLFWFQIKIFIILFFYDFIIISIIFFCLYIFFIFFFKTCSWGERKGGEGKCFDEEKRMKIKQIREEESEDMGKRRKRRRGKGGGGK